MSLRCSNTSNTGPGISSCQNLSKVRVLASFLYKWCRPDFRKILPVNSQNQHLQWLPLPPLCISVIFVWYQLSVTWLCNHFCELATSIFGVLYLQADLSSCKLHVCLAKLATLSWVRKLASLQAASELANLHKLTCQAEKTSAEPWLCSFWVCVCMCF